MCKCVGRSVRKPDGSLKLERIHVFIEIKKEWQVRAKQKTMYFQMFGRIRFRNAGYARA